MSKAEFLQGILPERTRHALRFINKSTGQSRSIFYKTIEEMAESAESYSDKGWDVYYATAGFGAGNNASSDNAVAKRELYLDVDCGPSKPYETKADGAAALKEFCKKVKLPRPTIVDSGNGLHAHWIFDEAVPVHKWKKVADQLKARCQQEEFHADGACTADIVRVLRVPETINQKNGAEVTLLTPIVHYKFEPFQALFSGIFNPSDNVFSAAKREKTEAGSALTKSLSTDPNKINKFEIIWARSIKDQGCAQIKNAVQNADTLSEPLWRAALSIANVCSDRDWAIHALSKDHPAYDPHETERKATLTRGPYTCETYQGLEEAALCANCKFAGRITSPVQLGVMVKEAKPDIPIISNNVKYEMPPLPFPYFRGALGGIYARMKFKGKKGEESDEDELEQELIYPLDLYAYKRMRDQDQGDVVCMRHHLPHDGVREFVISQKEVAALDKLRDRLNEQGVAAFSNLQLQKLQRYIGASICELQKQGMADNLFTRFGWTQDNTFVVGNREYTRDGVRHAPVARHMERYVPWFAPKGSLDEWKAIAAAYEDEAFDMHAFGVLSGFGSVLMQLSPENGAVVSYYSKQSGTGKTTILRMVNSIFGDPKALMKDAQDTHMTKVHRMGVMNGIALALDEMTNTTPQELSSLLYGSTQGRPRDRMKSNENAERTNDLMWKSISIWTSNTSIADRLSLIKVDPYGELARVIEIPLQTPVPSDVLEAQKLFNKLNDNYGHAGDVFMRYVIPNLEDVRKLWSETRDLIYSKRDWTQTERYRLNEVICAITAGIITNTLGLTNYNLSRITKNITAHIDQSAYDQKQASTSAIDTISAFINKNIGNMLRVDGMSRVGNIDNAPYTTPKGQLVVRYEPDTKRLFFVQKEFNRWCAENYINTSEFRSSYAMTTGRPLEAVRKRMGAGWDADFGSVWAYMIGNATEVLGVEDIGESATE